jgi:putative ABC transport system permease protein
MLDSWLRDARYALRLLSKSPLFTATAALSLAIGIGANTAIFSIASALLLRPLPGIADAGRLVDIGRSDDGRGFDSHSYPNYLDIRQRTTTLEGVFAYRIEPEPMSLTEGGDAERIYGSVVSANYFEVLGTRPHAGRLLRDEDDAERGGSPVAVISRGLWERRFAADPAMVGCDITLNGSRFTVVGIAPAGFQGNTILRSDVWIPMSMLTQAVPRMNASILGSRFASWLFLGGRLKPGVTVGQANAEAQAIAAQLEQEFPRDNRGRGLAVLPISAVPGQASTIAGFMGLLLAIVGLVLLIACVNVAGMLLARSAARRREIAVRLAIGAGRTRLIRQLLTETALLFAMGCALGLIISRGLTAALLTVVPSLPVPLSVDIVTDWRVIGFAAGVSLVAAFLSGLAPALQASRADLVTALKAEDRGTSPGRMRLRNAFIVGQIALSLVLIVAAGLFLRALQRAATIDPGFDQANVDVLSVDLSMAGYTAATGPAFLRELISRTTALPGVISATAAADLPLDGGRMGMGGINVAGVDPPPGQSGHGVDWNIVEPGYFRTLGMPLARGRDFTAEDTATSLPIAIVNEAFARRFRPDSDAIGQQLTFDSPDANRGALTIVGVVRDAKLVSLAAEAEPFVYAPLTQLYRAQMSILVKTAGGRDVVPDIRTLVRTMNPNLPLNQTLPLASVTALGLIPQRIAAAVAGSLGIVALLLAAIGIYGVTSYSVSNRTREIGIRMALGANRARVMRLVVRQALVLAGFGVGVGLVLAAAGSRLVESLLYGVKGLDPLTFAGACAAFAAITVLACCIPARRAAAVDPMAALRAE